MKANPEVEAAVLATLAASWDAYRRRDLDEVLSYYSSDADLVAVGTGAEERFVGPDSLKAGLVHDFSQEHEAALKISWASVSGTGNVAWVAADCIAEVAAGPRTISVPCRLTAVLEQKGDKWLIMQTHFSLPAGGAAATQKLNQG